MFKQAGRKRPTKQRMVDTENMIPQYQAALNELKQELAAEWLYCNMHKTIHIANY